MGMMALMHYSATRLGALKSADQSPRNPQGWTFTDKPRGLWVSVDGEDDWLNWCIEKGFRLQDLAVHHRITLKAPERILWLTGRPQLDAFQARYGVDCAFGLPSAMRAIDWAQVAQAFAGIIIAPYVWSARLSMLWYYTWDCASGCIWDTSVIDAVEVIEAVA